MFYTYYRLEYFTKIILCLYLLFTIHSFANTHEVSWSKDVLYTLHRTQNSNIFEPKVEKRLDFGKYIKSRNKNTFLLVSKNIPIELDYDIIKVNNDKTSTNLRLESNVLKKSYVKEDTRTMWNGIRVKRRQADFKAVDNSNNGNVDNTNCAFPHHRRKLYLVRKPKISNQRYPSEDYLVNDLKSSKNIIEFRDGNTVESEEMCSDLTKTSPQLGGSTINAPVAEDLHNSQKDLSKIEANNSSERQIRNTIGTGKYNLVLSRIGPLNMWVQHNLNEKKIKLTKSVRFGVWPEYIKLNNPTENGITQSPHRTKTLNFSDTYPQREPDMADKLRSQVRVLCWITVTMPWIPIQLLHIMDTWGKRCTKLLFISSSFLVYSPEVPIPFIRLNTSGDFLSWGITKEAMHYLNNYHLSDADWFLNTDDYSYVIMENLRYMLSKYDPKDLLYFRSRYNSSGAEQVVTAKTSYVLSRGAVERFGYLSLFKCKLGNDGLGNVELGQCLQNLSVEAMDTRDSLNRERFFAFEPQEAMFPDKKLLSYFAHKSHNEGMDCCSDYAISFNKMTYRDMRAMEYLVYHLRPYGVKFSAADENTKQMEGEASTYGHLSGNQIESDIQTESIGAYLKSSDRTYANRSVADELVKRVRVLCWVMTCPNNHQTKAIHIKATWGKRCDILLFVSSETDPSVPTIGVPIIEGQSKRWGKIKKGFRYVYKHYRENAEWFFKIDDDSYAVIENLRYMLLNYNPEDLLYFGFRYKPFTEQGFMAGGPGYVLSRAALDKFVEEGITQKHTCNRDDGGSMDDVDIGICLAKIGVKAMDSRDSMQRERFFFASVSDHFFPSRDPDYWVTKYVYYKQRPGLECCSKYGISYHYVVNEQVYVMEYLIYHLRPYGVSWNGTEPEEMLSFWLDKNKTLPANTTP